MKLRDGSTILVEGFPTSFTQKVSKSEKVLEKFEVLFDEIIQNHIVSNCRIIQVAFRKLTNDEFGPVKAAAEFGLQMSAEGDIYIVKAASQATFKITFEWQLKDSK